jgi:hypothetical protein
MCSFLPDFYLIFGSENGGDMIAWQVGLAALNPENHFLRIDRCANFSSNSS